MHLPTLFWMLAAIIVGAVGIRYSRNTPLALVCALLWVVFTVIAVVV